MTLIARIAMSMCVVAAVGVGQSTTLSSNFGSGGSFSLGIATGTVYPGALAYPFTVPQNTDYVFQSASLALWLGIGSQNSVTISLAADGGGVPGSVLETFVLNGVLQAFPNDNTPVTVNSVFQPLLKAGSVYWIIEYPTYPGNGVNWLTAQVLTTPDLQAVRFNGTWTASALLYGTNDPGAFSVSGTPVAPILTFPDYIAANISLAPTLTWNASPQATSYDVYLGTSFPPALAGNTTGTSFNASNLSPNTSYYWQVVAHDSVGLAASTLSTFNTGAQPTPVITPTSVTPAVGTGYTRTFTFTFSDSAGASNFTVLDVLMNNYLDGVQACYFAFTPTGPSSGYFYLVDDAGDGGYVSGSPMSFPSNGVLQNSQCSINLAASSVISSGNTLTLAVALNFTLGFTGNKIFYTAARTASQNSGWQALGTWNVPTFYGSSVPTIGGMSPGRITNTSSTFTFTFNDFVAYGYQNFSVLDVLINSFLDGITACYFAYVPVTATDGYLYLVDDAGDGQYVTGSPMLLSSGGSMHNSQCTLDTNGASATASGYTLNLTLPITFSSGFAGNRIFYLAARDHAIGNSEWQAVGSVTVP